MFIPVRSETSEDTLGQRLACLGAHYRRHMESHQGRGAARLRRLRCRLDAWRNLPQHGPYANELRDYALDLVRRSILFLDVLRRRGNEFLEYEASGQPPLLAFDYETLIDGRQLERPVNYCLVRIIPPEGVSVQPTKRPYLIVDPRAGHGAGIGGFKQESQVGVALREGNPVYFAVFYPEPQPGQTLRDVADAEALFVREVARRHPASPKPAIIGNCQGGWAVMGLAAIDSEITGPLILNGAPLSYWAGVDGKNPLRYLGGLAGGGWLANFLSDLGKGRFDGAWLVQNFEALNLANTWWTKYYHLFAHIDTEAQRFLDFEKWWGGFVQLTGDEIRAIVDDLFIGNKLATGGIPLGRGLMLDLRRIRSPIVVFCSQGDDITPPQQALNWIADTYLSAREIKAHGQTIVYIIHADTGHLGIFVSGAVVHREFSQIAGTLAAIEALPPGLYELIIEDAPVNGRGLPQYEVSLHERQIEDILAHDDTREDERQFKAVAAVAELNTRAYELLAAPWVRVAANDLTAWWLRKLHPMRVQRYLWSDLNPWTWWLPAAASQTHLVANRPVSPDNPLLALQAAWADLVETSLDGLREVRDASMEDAFHWVYGYFDFLGLGAQPAPAESGAGRRQDDPPRLALAGLTEGGVREAVIRMLLLLMKAAGSVRRETLAYVQERLNAAEAFADTDPQALRAILTTQSTLVAYEPERALQTLPLLLPGAESRREALGILHSVLREDMLAARPMLRAAMRQFEAVLGEAIPAAA
jgi:uncharacterized protein DUF3141